MPNMCARELSLPGRCVKGGLVGGCRGVLPVSCGQEGQRRCVQRLQ